MKSLFLTALLSIPCWAFSQSLELVADINQEPIDPLVSNAPEHLVEYNNQLYFSGLGAGLGRELLRYDGTSIALVEDLNVSGSSNPRYLTEAAGNLFFVSNFSSNDPMKLMMYDGSNAVQELFDINANFSDSYPRIQEFGGNIYFTSYNSNGDWELRESDGITASTVIYSNQGSANYSSIRGMTSANNQLYFYADGIGFLQYDGTNAAVVAPNSTTFSTVSVLLSYDNEVFFVADEVNTGFELWRYDGANAPSLVADIYPGIQSGVYTSNEEYHRFAEFEGDLYFQAFDGTNGSELWSYDGNGVSLIDVNPTGGSSPSYLTVFNSNLYFYGFEATSGGELWQFDGTNASQVADIWPGTSWSGIKHPVVFQNELFFGACDGASEAALFKCDGSITEKAIVSTANQGSQIRYLTKFQNKIYFRGYGPLGSELYETNGTTTSLVADLNPGFDPQQDPNNSIPSYLFVFDGVLYFQAFDGGQFNMYEFDGVNTPTVTSLFSINDNGFFEFNNELYYSSNDGTSGAELWKYDGTNAPTLIADINPGIDGSFPANFEVFNGNLYFSAYENNSGEELWEYDGTNAPTLVADLNPTGDSYPFNLKSFNGKLYFSAFTDNTIGTELYEYDGVNSPVLTADIWTGTSGGWANESYPSSSNVINGKLVFLANGASGLYSLWEYDGINAPVEITNYNPSGSSGQFSGITAIDDVLYFWADEGSGLGSELYQYDGTSIPAMFDELAPGAPRSRAQSASNMVSLGGYIYLNANDWIIGGNNGLGELYRLPVCTSFTINIVQLDDVLTADAGYATYQWFDANGIITGANSNTYTVTSNGSYYCEVTDGAGCFSVTASVDIDNVGIEALDLIQAKLYPNPTNGMIHIETEHETFEIRITSVNGSIVGVYQQKEIDLSSLESGVYLASFIVEDNARVFRIVKQ